MVIESRATEQVHRWACNCSMHQAGRWLDLAAQNALDEGGQAAARLAEVADHFLSRVRRAA